MTTQCLMLSKTLCQDLDTPISLGVYLRQKYGEWDDFLSMKIDPQHYLDTSLGAERFLRDTQAIQFLRKFPDLPIKRDLDKEAIDAFFELERKNALTNRRLYPMILNYNQGDVAEPIHRLIDRVKRRIARVLGEIPDSLSIRFGKGAVFESRGHPFAKSLTVADKMTLPVTLTTSAVPFSLAIWESAWGRSLLTSKSTDHFQYCRGSRFGTVPKDATRHRHINVEPGGNMSLQLAVGRVVRKALKRVGLDLNKNQEVHRALARLSSISNRHATIDLSNASDTISTALIRLLLPPDWFSLLDDLRSKFTYVNGKGWVKLEKFSSMGNGFTFELETLVFSCITAELCGGWEEVWAYGDDLIFPVVFGPDVISALRFFGMEVNVKKSFLEGPFRESCGGDYFQGFPVRPFILDFNPKEPHEYISLANGLRRAALQLRMGGRYFGRAWRRTAGFIPADIRRCVGPSALGDLTLNTGNWCLTNARTRSSIRYVRVWRPIPKRVMLTDARFHPETQLATILYGSAEMPTVRPWAFSENSGEFISSEKGRWATLTPRGGVSGFRFGRVPYS